MSEPMSEAELFLLGAMAEAATARAHLLRALSHLERSGRRDLSTEVRRLRQLAASLSDLESGIKAAYEQEREGRQ